MEDTTDLVSSHPTTTIMDIPDDCLVSIFSRLSGSSDREAFGLTCCRWLNIQNLNRHSLHFLCSLTHFEIPLSQVPPKVEACHIHRLLTRFPNLHSLSLSGCTELPDIALKLLSLHTPFLQHLCLDCCFEITDTGLSFFGHGQLSLKSISLYRCNITDVGLEILGKCPTLENVNISYCSLVTDQGIRALVQNCRFLCRITISNCREITGVGFRGCSETLSYLEAESCKLDPEGISSIVSGSGLEYLNIMNLNWSAGLAMIGSGLASRLRVLNMGLCRIVTDESVLAIAKGCPVLQEWNLALCHEVRVFGWESIGLHCRNLEKLHVSRCRNLCDIGLKGLRNGCKKLCVLYMNGCPRVSSNAIELFRLLRSDVVIKAEEIFSIGPAREPRW